MNSIDNFELIQSEHIPERDLTATLYTHIKTGARVMMLDNDDDNKVFAISFRTPVIDSLGIPHILEHSVLQGSRNYPLKEPFGELIKSSLASYINAITYPDKTLYPVASTNTKDFFNLAGVYLDAVFHPLLTDNTLDREGWHYEIDPDTNKLIYKGVVYNEMLGAYSNPYGEIFDESSSLIFPDTTYVHRSGGNPQQIPQLTHEQIREFHSTYYHPSNSYSFFYGNDRSDERFRLLDEYFSQYERKIIDSQIQTQNLNSIPHHATADIINFTDPNHGSILRSYVFSDAADTTDTYKRYLEAYYLLGTSGSPLYKALKDSELGEEVIILTPDMGMPQFDQLAQKWVLFGLKNVATQDFDAVDTLITNTISTAIQNIDPANLESALNTLEFNLRENDTGRTPQGIELIDTILAHWLYDGDPFEALGYASQLKTIAHYLTQTEEFADNIRTYWLDYPHQTRIDLTPNITKKDRWAQDIQDRLEQQFKTLQQSDIDTIKQQQNNLKAEQEASDTLETLALLPTLALSDLNPTGTLIAKEVTSLSISTQESTNSVECVFHQQPTNDIIYLDLKFNIDHIPYKLLRYLPLYSQMLFETGTTTRSLEELQFDIGRYTGGLSMSPDTSYSRSGKLTIWFDINARCLPQYAQKTAELITDIIHNACINNITILKQLITENRSNYESSIASGGLSYVMSSLSGALSPQGYIDELLEGIPQYEFIKSIDTENQEQLADCIRVFQELTTLIFSNYGSNIDTSIIGITTTSASKDKAEYIAQTILTSLPMRINASTQNTSLLTQWQYTPDRTAKAYTTTGTVNFVGFGFNLTPTGYQPTGSSLVVCNYLRPSFLWEKIRLIGGAYDAMANFDDIRDVYTYCSYRDPNISSTLAVYQTVGQHLESLTLSDDEIRKNIIGTIGTVDRHLLPHQKGATSFARHIAEITPEYLQQRREEIMATSISDFHKIGQNISQATSSGVTRIVGNHKQIIKELAKNDIIITPLLR